MDRRSVVKGIGAIGLGAMLPVPAAAKAVERAMRKAALEQVGQAGTCWLTPSETEGPYYFNANLVRQDIRTDVDTGAFHDGLPFMMAITVIDAACNPIPNVLVDVWHADKDGVYSGYAQPGGVNTVGQDFMRGIQPTDANGQCQFITSYPGWYPGRATHVHFKVRFNSTTYVTSQFGFLDSVNDAVYQTPLYAARGSNPTTNAEDMVFQSPNPPYEIMSATPNAETGGYDGAFTIGISAPVGVEEAAAPSPERVRIRANTPSPFTRVTTVSYYLPASTHVSLAVYDLLGRRVATLVDGVRPAGANEATFDAVDLVSGYYFFKIVAGGASDAKETLLLK